MIITHKIRLQWYFKSTLSLVLTKSEPWLKTCAYVKIRNLCDSLVSPPDGDKSGDKGDLWTLNTSSHHNFVSFHVSTIIPFYFHSNRQSRWDETRGQTDVLKSRHWRRGAFSSSSASISASPSPSLLSIFRAFSPLQRGRKLPTAHPHMVRTSGACPVINRTVLNDSFDSFQPHLEFSHGI